MACSCESTTPTTSRRPSAALLVKDACPTYGVSPRQHQGHTRPGQPPPLGHTCGGSVGAPVANRARTPAQRTWMARLGCALLSLRGSCRAVGHSLTGCWPGIGEGCRPRSLARAAPVAPLVMMQRLGNALPCRVDREGLFYSHRSRGLRLARLVLVFWLSAQLAEGSASRSKNWRFHGQWVRVSRPRDSRDVQPYGIPTVVWLRVQYWPPS
jgi:hypothetical protein